MARQCLILWLPSSANGSGTRHFMPSAWLSVSWMVLSGTETMFSVLIQATGPSGSTPYRVILPISIDIVLYGKSQIQSCIDNRNLSKSSTSLSATWRTTTVQARANSTKTTTRCLCKCFTVMSGKVNSYKGEKIIITTQTNYLKATTKRNQRKRWK